MTFQIESPALKESSQVLDSIFTAAKNDSLNLDKARILIDAVEQKRCLAQTDLKLRMALRELREIEAKDVGDGTLRPENQVPKK